jgi:hypothetical protein
MVTNEQKRKEEMYKEDKGVEWDSTASDFKHHSLVTLVIFGFESEDYMVSYVRRPMAVAVNLKNVLLYCRLECDSCKADQVPLDQKTGDFTEEESRCKIKG